jgi:hypothetical protein
MLYEHFIDNPLLAKFWVETAMDELQHHSILRFCRERGMMADMDIDSQVAEQIEDSLETIKGIVNDPEVSINEAFYGALLMECSELEDIYEKLSSPLARDHRLLYDAVQTNLRSHHATFARAAEEFCSDRGLAEAFKNVGRRVA